MSSFELFASQRIERASRMFTWIIDVIEMKLYRNASASSRDSEAAMAWQTTRDSDICPGNSKYLKLLQIELSGTNRESSAISEITGQRCSPKNRKLNLDPLLSLNSSNVLRKMEKMDTLERGSERDSERT